MSKPVMGVDPGLASCGWGVIQRQEDGSVKLLDVGVTKTEKQDKKKVLIAVRVNVDDQARIKLIWNDIMAMIAKHEPRVMGIESYAPAGRPNANGWKAALAYGMVSGMAYSSGIRLLPHLAQDLKRKIAGDLSASKEDVQASVEKLVVGAKKAFAKMNKGAREHAADAVGHAYLALLEVEAHAAQVEGFL